MIKLTNVRKAFQNRLALNNINYEFPRNGLCIIYGQSGSGKTTLLNCLSGLISFEGSIEIDHQRIETLNDEELSNLRLSSYGFVFQDFKLFENETVAANLLFPLETLNHLPKNVKDRKCEDLLSLVGLEHKEKQIVNKLSGGEKQRVAIARALVNDPKVLLADEPTGSLDEKNSIEIMNILKIISKNSLVIMVSHDQELTKKYADQIIEMDSLLQNFRIPGDDRVWGQSHISYITAAVVDREADVPALSARLVDPRKIVRNPQWEAVRQFIENRATQRQLDHQAKLWDIIRRNREEVNGIQRSVISNMQQTGERVVENWDTYIRDVDVRDVPGVGKVEFSSLADKEWYDPKTGEHVIYNGGDGGFDPQELGMTGLVSRDEYPRAQ